MTIAADNRLFLINSDRIVNWASIHDRDCPLVIEKRNQPLADDSINGLLADAPFSVQAEGTVAEIITQFSDYPADVRDDIAALAQDFMQLMRVNKVRVRLEGVTSNACKKIHADYTDVRLITTYAGPGTDYAPHGEGDCCVERIEQGAVALFKGRSYAPDHPPCFHRSPPIEGSGQSRLVLVIDTPLGA